ncbi:hypothetical protein MAR_033482 [Mya arenaria]|uniref:Fibronectin type-III domain-containing protein n=1 Tax=Mya arenaria TaxID=6604 RepID=A0ABY7G957_MYAAR|nr:hypothetical protein MAR_033482 [Mya arenaria]
MESKYSNQPFVITNGEELKIPFCEPCKESKRDVKASRFCKECDEYLCEKCTGNHKKQKMNKGHDTIDVVETLKGDTIYCEPCKEINQEKTAQMFCPTCEEYLCNDCVETHKKMKMTKTHLPKELVKEHCNLTEDVNKDKALRDKPEQTIYSRAQASLGGNEKYTRPGKPVQTTAGSDFIVLSWDPPANFQDGNYYQVSMKDVDQNSKWKFYNKEFTTASGKIGYIKSNTKFIFRVRFVHKHGEGSYSPESDVIITFPSPASRIVDFSTKVDGQNPTTYALPVTENRTARDETAKSRQFWLGSPPVDAPKEKTIMLIGATGTGKSTLVDGIVNYILGVNWDDPFRFTIIDLEDEEKQRETNQALSQTEWITRYTIFPEKGSRVSYCLNIIDTPGFGDTRGLQRDQEIVEQIRQPFFADGIDPPVLAALKESNLPYGEYFTFNNSSLFSRNAGHISLAKMFWDVGNKSFQHFFSHLEQGNLKSLQLTKDVLDERFKLEQTVKNLQPQLDAGLLKVNQMKQEIAIIDRNKSTIKDNANFTYEVDETYQKKRKPHACQHVTNCTHCHFTCHENPPVLAALKESNLPYGEYFTFNNSSLFSRNAGHISLAKMFWDMGNKSFQQFFLHLDKGKPRNLQFTKEILDERFRLEQTVKNLQPELEAGLLKVNQIKQEIALLDSYKSTIKDNANFTYEVEQAEQKRRELLPGQLVTNCNYCYFTCHENCDIPDDDRKKGCIAIDGNGFCTVCPNKCKWDKHANIPYIFEYVSVKVKKNLRLHAKEVSRS